MTTYTPDGTGNVARVTKGNGTYTDFKYAWGIVSEIANPQFTVTREVNEDGTVRSETRGGRTTTFEYDGLFRVTKSQPPAANAFVTAYAPAGDTITMTRGPSRTVTTVDGFGRPIRVQTETGSGVIVTSTSYDADGRTVFESLPAYGGTGPGTELVYDPLGRVRQQWPHGADGARLSTHVEIDRSTAGRVSIADENGRTTTQDWAAFGNPDEGRLVAVTDAGQETWRYSYNALGTLTYVDAPGDADRSWVYDSHNLLRSESHPESGTTFYDDYDGAGNLRHTRDANNIGTSYEYDDAERLSRVISDQRVTTFTYAPGAEERRTASVGGIVSTFGYDDAGRLRRRVDVIPGSNTLVQQLDYDGNDNLIRLEYPSGRVATFAYDQANRVISIATAASSDASPANFAWNFSYHPSGAILSYRTANNLDHVFEYEPSRYRLTRIAAGALQLHYSDYDAVGNVRRIDDGRTGTSQVFTYDGLDRLQEASGPYGSMRFDYDAHGNRMSNAFGSYDYDTRFRLRSDGPNRTYTYDDNGNLKTGPYGGDSYDYTPDNLLSASTVAGQTTAYRYDGDGWRIARTDSNGAVSTFARGANGQLLSEVRSTGIHRDYVYAGSRLIGMIRKVVDTSKPLVAQEPPEANPDGPRLGLNFTASSRNSAPLMTADLARAAATTACTTGETSGCAWSSVASVTAPTNTLAWVPSAPLVDTAPPIGVAMLYQVRVTDREGITGEGEPAEVEIAADTLPDAFTFADRADVELNTVIESNVVRIAGVTGSASVSVAGALFRVCADSACGDNPSFTAASGTVSSGSYLQLRVTSSGSYGTGVTATLTVGTGGASWIVTTRMPDSTPDPFSFTDRTGVGLSTTVQSNIVQVSGITDQVSISIAGAGTYRICSDTTCASSPAFTAAPQTIANGAYVQLQATSSASYGTASSATLTVGTVSDTWSVTTGAAPAVVLTTTRTGSGQGTISGSGINCGATCQQTLPAGTAVSLTATPGSGYVFAGWSGGGCTGTGTCHFTIAANVTVTAAFNCTRPTGGTITAAGGYTLHTFTANGTFNAGSCINNVQYLIVGAGGSGGDLRGGGGGGGGVLTGSVAVSATSYSVVVGLGNSGSNGGNSSAFGKTATGGGRGANEGGNGASGGSGGGGSGPGTSGGAGVSGQGYAGGGGELDGDHVAGGGGGGAGGTGTQGWWGPGGPGRQVWGVYYGGGGGGNEDIGSGSGGIGGGGDGGAGGNPSTQGADHLGGGGGGGESKRGGHGVVIVRYPSL